MAAYMLIRHKVNDFASWKTAYDAHRSAREEFGISEKQILRGADDPNEVVILMEIADIKRAKAFAAAPEVHEAMQKAGVIDKPDVYFLNS